jgi:hypothetical protein
MASFGSGFNDYVNGLRPPRSSLDGIKLTSVRGPRSSPVADANGGPSTGMLTRQLLVLRFGGGGGPRCISQVTHALSLMRERMWVAPLSCCAHMLQGVMVESPRLFRLPASRRSRCRVS